ncbi:MAG TPA: hypothetical protein VJ306_01445 [Pyrinomonadaceae bacterium]|nr:hypothetical protein [Pyrinomonadaceae bacterium]
MPTFFERLPQKSVSCRRFRDLEQHEQAPQSLPGRPPPGFISWDWSPDGTLLVGAESSR